MAEALQSLSEKEKETLRLIVRGHDAKSAATQLNLSVHTVNGRLRDARRKLSVTSSREAARLLLESEGDPDKFYVGKGMGAESRGDCADPSATARRHHGGAWLTIGVLIMLSFVALAYAISSATTDPVDPGESGSVTSSQADAIVETSAREWLALTDAADWMASYQEAGTQFRELNTPAMWSEASQQARAPLGAVLARQAIAFEHINAPPHGYIVARFKTDFATRQGAVETVTLEREEGGLRVVGYLID